MPPLPLAQPWKCRALWVDRSLAAIPRMLRLGNVNKRTSPKLCKIHRVQVVGDRVRPERYVEHALEFSS